MKKNNMYLTGMGIFLFLLVLGSCVSASNTKPETVPVYDIPGLIGKLPDGQVWVDHLKNDLMPFWLMPSALGEPAGNFPTYRAEDGKVVNPGDPLPPSYQAAKDQDPELFDALIKIDRSYIRAQARQTFAYGIAYHMTGEEKYLKLAKTGVDYLVKNGIDRVTDGGAYSYYDKKEKKWGPAVPERTSQDMAYALSGIGFYYYLTRDPDVLKDILYIKNHIFNTYYDKEIDLLRWVVSRSADGDTPDQKELVAQLDQVYGYMLWLAPSLPAEIGVEWKKDLEHLALLMIKQFFSTEYGFFWGQITNSTNRYVGAPHTDFGHSIKTLWLIGQVGKYVDNIALVNFSREYAKKLIDTAYIEKTGSWARRFDEKGNIDYDKEWWILAELDQMTATLALNDPSLVRYLINTYHYWLTYMIDKQHGEIWHMVSAVDNKPILKFPKEHSWKNSFHSTEHALISYLTTRQIKGKPITLYFAFKNKYDMETYAHPYFYKGKYNIAEVKENAFSELAGLTRFEVVFTDLH